MTRHLNLNLREFGVMPSAVTMAAVVLSCTLAVAQSPSHVASEPELQRLVRALKVQLELTHRANAPEHRRRQALLAYAMEAWNESPREAADRELFEAWLRQAIRASMPGPKRRMPALPDFGVVAASRLEPETVPEPEALPSAPTPPAEVASVGPEEPEAAEAVEARPEPILSEAVATQLWEQSPAAAPLDIEALMREASSHQPPVEAPPATDKPVVAVQPDPEPVEETSIEIVVERPRRTSVESETLQAIDIDLPPLELISVEPFAEISVSNTPEVGSPEVVESIVRETKPAMLQLATPPPIAEPASELLAENEVDSEGGEGQLRVAVRKPIAEPADNAIPVEAVSVSAPEPLAFDLSELADKVDDYNSRLERIERELKAVEKPSAFDLGAWARQLDRLGRVRRFTSIYLNGIGEEQRSSIEGFGSAKRAIQLLRQHAASRRQTISGLPAQAVRAELQELASIERLLPTLEEDHR